MEVLEVVKKNGFFEGVRVEKEGFGFESEGGDNIALDLGRSPSPPSHGICGGARLLQITDYRESLCS